MMALLSFDHRSMMVRWWLYHRSTIVRPSFDDGSMMALSSFDHRSMIVRWFFYHRSLSLFQAGTIIFIVSNRNNDYFLSLFRFGTIFFFYHCSDSERWFSIIVLERWFFIVPERWFFIVPEQWFYFYHCSFGNKSSFLTDRWFFFIIIVPERWFFLSSFTWERTLFTVPSEMIFCYHFFWNDRSRRNDYSGIISFPAERFCRKISLRAQYTNLHWKIRSENQIGIRAGRSDRPLHTPILFRDSLSL